MRIQGCLRREDTGIEAEQQLHCVSDMRAVRTRDTHQSVDQTTRPVGSGATSVNGIGLRRLRVRDIYPVEPVRDLAKR